MVTNQHRDQDRAADAKFLEEAVEHLRYQVQRASGGWSVEPSDDGRHLIASGLEPFRETVIETRGLYAETIQAYLLTMDPARALSLLALLEDLQRAVRNDSVPDSVRRAAVRYAEDVMGRKRSLLAPRRMQ